MKSTKWGGAISTFGESYTHDGTHLKESFEYKTVGLSMLNAMNDLKILQPHYIKMDVDGIEHLILKGGMKVLLGVKSVLVEVNDDFKYQSKMVECYLKEAGFILKKKEQAKMFAGTSSFNQIWHKE